MGTAPLSLRAGVGEGSQRREGGGGRVGRKGHHTVYASSTWHVHHQSQVQFLRSVKTSRGTDRGQGAGKRGGGDQGWVLGYMQEMIRTASVLCRTQTTAKAVTICPLLMKSTLALQWRWLGGKGGQGRGKLESRGEGTEEGARM